MEKTEIRMTLRFLVWDTRWYDWTIYWYRKKRENQEFNFGLIYWDTCEIPISLPFSFLFWFYCYTSFIKPFIRVSQGRCIIKNDSRLRHETTWVNEKHANEKKLEKPRVTVVLKLWLQSLFKFLCPVFVSASLGIPIVNLFTDNLNLPSHLLSFFLSLPFPAFTLFTNFTV